MAARRLTRKQEEFVAAFVETGIGVRAALAAYDTESYETANAISVENLQKPSILEEVKKALAAKHIGPETWGKVLEDAMNAETVLITGPGQTISQPDHGTRLKAVALAAKLSDAYPRQGVREEHSHRHLHLDTTESPEVLRFKVIHGRTPTPKELEEILPPVRPPEEDKKEG